MTSPKEEVWREDWSRKGFYATMLRLFRPRPDPLDGQGKRIIRPVTPPFFKNRPLGQHEFWATVDQSLLFQGLERRVLKQADSGVEIPDHAAGNVLAKFGIAPAQSWPYIRALGLLHFAETAKDQAQAKKEVRALAQRGPRALRCYLADILRRVPPRKAILSHRKVVLDLLRYRKKRQFVWAFLRLEARAAWECGPKDLRRRWLEELSRAYPFLQLTPDQLKRGLCNPRQVDEDVARKFGLSPKAVRSLLSKRHPPLKSSRT